MAQAHIDQTRDEAADPTLGDDGRWFGSLGSMILFLITAWAIFLALLPLSDNSFFTHLATGRLILDSGGVPSSDPYSFTAPGAPWTVQSWLPSVAYAAAERAGGVLGLRLLILATFLVATVFLWMLTRAAQSILIRFAIAAAGMVVAAGTWGERPYMIGLIGLALTWLALDDEIPGWLLLPFGWIWANSHGSFPLALILCSAVIVGTWLDDRSGSASRARRQLTACVYLSLGLLLGAISPLGFRGLIFPLRALMDSETFRLIREWQSPEFTSTPQRVFLVLLVLAVLAAVRIQRWQLVLPLVVFSAMALMAVRNIVMAMPVVLVVLAAGAPPVGTLRSATRPVGGGLLAGLAVAIATLVAIDGLRGPGLDTDDYPGGALAWSENQPRTGRLLTQDFVGNFVEILDGRNASVFVDDRADMYPVEILEQYVVLDRAAPGWSEVLDDHRIETVVWKRDAPLGSVLAADPRWRIVYSDGRWAVAQRR